MRNSGWERAILKQIFNFSLSMCMFYPGVFGAFFFFEERRHCHILCLYSSVTFHSTFANEILSHVRFKIIQEGRWGMPCHPILHIYKLYTCPKIASLEIMELALEFGNSDFCNWMCTVTGNQKNYYFLRFLD